MRQPVIERLPLAAEPRFEVVERKGVGHPDSICDALCEELSLAYARFCRERLGAVPHHNLDKALLVGGRSRARFGGGELLRPIEIILAGRAAARLGDLTVPLAEMAEERSLAWLDANLHALDPETQVRLATRIRPGSAELGALFARGGAGGPPLANDSSIGVGYAPLSSLEHLVLRLESALNADARGPAPWLGEDIKVMALRRDGQAEITVACAFVARHVADLEAYVARKAALAERVRSLAGAWAPQLDVAVHVNAADDESRGSVYLTVTGTSAEAGDDGEAGRGNRVNGLIAPGRAMTMESVAGKNPVSHVGKLYNVAAGLLAEDLVARLDFVRAAQCVLVSRIGSPITEPQLCHVRLRAEAPLDDARARQVDELTRDHLRRLPEITEGLLDGRIGIDRWPLRMAGSRFQEEDE